MPTSNSNSSSKSIAEHYDWREQNRLPRFKTWEEEIAYMQSLGYTLAPSNYMIPHWTVALEMGATLPKLYLLGEAGPRETSTHHGCYAARLGYPVYFRSDAAPSAAPVPQGRYLVLASHARKLKGELYLLEPLLSGVVTLPMDATTQKCVEAGWLRAVEAEEG